MKYWLTFNEINIMLHSPYSGAGLVFEEGENQEQVKYQAAHHELVASALATKIAHEINPQNQVGCMLAGGNFYPYSCKPEDVWMALEKDRENLFFIDVQPAAPIRCGPRECSGKKGSRLRNSRAMTRS